MSRSKIPHRKISIAFALIVASISGLLATDFYNSYGAELEALQLRHQEQVAALQDAANIALDTIDGLQAAARNQLEHAHSLHSAYHQRLGLIADRNGYGLSELPPPRNPESRLNLTGLGLLEGKDLQQELHAALTLEPMFKWVRQVYPDTPWVYYLSARRFMAVYPYIPFDDFFMEDAFYTMDLYRLGAPDSNQQRSHYITPVYEDEAGQGLMVTIGAPVYTGTQFRGIVGFDLTLASLAQSLQRRHDSDDAYYLVNDQGEVIAHAGPGKPQADDFQPRPADSFQPGLQARIDLAAAPSSFRLSGNYFHVSRLAGTPWALVSEGDHWRILANATLASLPLLVFLLALTAGFAMLLRERRYQELARTEAALLSERDKLQLMVEEKTRDLLNAKEAAESAAHTKATFLANMSHEIRTPLNAVLGMARIGRRDSSDSTARNHFEQILGSGEHLLRVINDILDFSKIEAGKLNLENTPFELANAIEQAVAMSAPRAEKKALAIRLQVNEPLPDWVSGDPLRLKQIVLNLLSNAIKFTEQGSVSVELGWREGIACLKVVDTGIGMSEQQLQRLFNPFEQADSSTTRQYGGTGLGLAICHSLVELMNGSIEVSSTPGQGSQFSVYLPLNEAAEPLPRQAVESSHENGAIDGLRILAAEDVDINRLILEDLLQSEGAEVVFAENGQLALEILRQQGAAAFDAVLMDIQMPVMDGYQATREIHRTNPELPVIGLTAHALSEERQKCLDCGMVAHLTKPIDQDELFRTLRAHCRNS